ncbi:MAG: metalloprotease PmbA [Lysobacterales bacterium]
MGKEPKPTGVIQGPDREAELDALESTVLEALRQARKLGASEAEAATHLSQGLSVSVRMGDVETLEHMQDRGITVTVYLGRRKGQASSADLRPESVDACVRHAMDIARFTQEDSCNGLAEPELMATDFPDLDLWHPVSLDAQSAIERALACEAAGRSDRRISNSEGASFDAGLGLAVYGNSTGFMGRSAGTHYSQSCILLAGSGENMKRDYSYDARRALGDLEPPERTGAEAARRTIGRLGARQIKTRHVPVLFAPEVARSLVGHLVGAVSGSSLYRNASFLKDKAGERLFGDWVRLLERPRLARGAASASFDAEGVATRERHIIESGVLTGYVLSSYSARRLGLQTTGNAGGVRNLLLEPGGEGREDPLASMGEGLYVTEVMGQGVNLVTGDYSRGAAGFLVEGGALSHPVEEVTVAGNLRDMFRDIVVVGNDVDTRGNIQCGPVLVSNMVVGGS